MDLKFDLKIDLQSDQKGTQKEAYFRGRKHALFFLFFLKRVSLFTLCFRTIFSKVDLFFGGLNGGPLFSINFYPQVSKCVKKHLPEHGQKGGPQIIQYSIHTIFSILVVFWNYLFTFDL